MRVGNLRVDRDLGRDRNFFLQGDGSANKASDAARNANREILNVPSYSFINLGSITPQKFVPAFEFPMREFSGQYSDPTFVIFLEQPICLKNPKKF